MIELAVFELLKSLGGAILFATIFFLKNRRQKDHDFEISRYLSVLAIGMIVWAGAMVTGASFTQAGLETQLMAYSGAIALLSGVMKSAFKGNPLAAGIKKGIDKLPSRKDK